ncbi:hypothetical protein LTR66_013591 [Elasticomyces elasticus]|nr:hypothetical protein LTR66_013591 [Elasticomyces elasticus]
MTNARTLDEDDLYRASSQYRLWSFTQDSLLALRANTHALAVERANTYLELPPDGTDGEGAAPGGINGAIVTQTNGAHTRVLTAEEDLKLVLKSCTQITATCDRWEYSTNVREIYKCVLFLALKTEGTHIPLSHFAHQINTEAEKILAPEYKIIQALRFTLDVKQPYRALKGGLMELLNMSQGIFAIPGNETTPQQLHAEMLALPPPTARCRSHWKPSSGSQTTTTMSDRVKLAYDAAKTVLNAAALLTDVYFLYTPSQIFHASLRLADEPLSSFYLCTKIAESSPIRTKALTAVHACADALASFSHAAIISKEERVRLEERLEWCRDPSTINMVRANAVARRNGQEEGILGDGVARRRKLEREASLREGEELFGPGLVK